VSQNPQSHWNEERIRRVTVCSVGLLALLLAGGALPTDVKACHDFGDAPVSYGTRKADDGARHKMSSDLYLGKFIDDEYDGRPSVDADGDDLNELDDEDGIAFISLLTRGMEAQLDATLTEDGLLNAWIDFDANGVWDDDEQIFTDEELAGDVTRIEFTVPLDASVGYTYARFRLNSGGGLTPYGSAADGEVEDYQVSIAHVPEPAAWSLVAFGLTASAAFRRLRK
jgi:hypothetical protein